MKSWNIATRLQSVVVIFGYALLWAPIIIIILFSFNSDPLSLAWQGFTLKWYPQIFGKAAVRSALRMSLIVASITVVVATIVGTLAAYGLYKYKFRGKEILRTGILLPLVMPYVVIGGSLLVFFTQVIHIPLGYPSIIIAHITFSTPLAVFVVLGRMQRIDWTLEEASADLGGDKLTTWRKITLPLLLPAILTSMVLIFPWSFDDFTITFFVAGVGSMTLPIYIFSQIRYGYSGPIINAIGTIFVLLPIIGLLLMNFLRKKEVT